jgi:hypothetical protein
MVTSQNKAEPLAVKAGVIGWLPQGDFGPDFQTLYPVV